MESSAPKRRKTSPTTSVPVDNTNDNVSPASSDSSGTRRSSRLNRPSFASPTKSSLARSNPDILTRRHSERRNSEAPAASEPDNNSNRSHDSDEGLLSAQLEADSETGRILDAQSSDRIDNKGKGKETAVAPAARSTSPVRKAGGGFVNKPKRSPLKNVLPSPRPLPPPSTEEEELIDPFKGRRRLARSPPPGVLPPVDREEPELPPTPTQKGLSDPSSVISSPLSPSKRPRRSKVLAEKMKSSPLKQPPLRPPEEDVFEEGEPIEGFSTKLKASISRDPLRNSPKRRKKKKRPHPARQVEEPDPLADKKGLRDSLLAEVAKLQKDLEITSRENERLNMWQESKRGDPEPPSAEEQKQLIDVLGRHALPPEEESAPDPIQDWLEAAMNPILFLPFGQSNASSIPPMTFPIPQPKSQESEDPLPPPVSHHPIHMTADEELPYLQVFTPLAFTSTITTIPREEAQEGGEDFENTNANPLLQKHTISITSTPPGLFIAGIEMVVNTKTLSIADLTVPRLDPAAVNELGPYIERLLQDSGGSKCSALTRNISVITWAMGEWVRMATRRARFWHSVEREMGTAEDLLACAKSMRQASSSRRKRWRGRPGRRAAAEDSDEESDAGSKKKRSQPSKAELLALMGRSHFDLDLTGAVIGGDGGGGDGDDGQLTARIQWSIEFDWTGEASSKIGFLLGAPVQWRADDKQERLAGISKMFSELLRESKDPMEALRTVVALVVGDEEGGLG
ncbi:hypothetical protein F5Y16DRAFT_354027 [Xylariaceae sp. FL0255]|nr:hypothetical protein F5Y16DRAFT_354027 [Xylariaceae sp. FL0255]